MSMAGNSGGGQKPPPSTLTGRGWITLRQFAEVMDITYQSAMRWVFEERVKTVIVGGRHRVYEDEVRFVLDHGTRPPNPEKVGKFGKTGSPKSGARHEPQP